MPPMKKYRAILFDFDGVIGQTMEDNYRAWAHVFAPLGVSIPREEYFLQEGKSPQAVAIHFLTAHGADIGLADALAIQKDRYYARHNTFALYDGVEQVIRELKATGVLLGLVTGARRKRLLGAGIGELLRQFDVVITADECAAHKPDPAPFVAAAETLGVAPETCCVVENAPLGVAAAKGAAMDCIAVCSTLPREWLHEADWCVEQVADIAGILLR